MTGLTDKEEQLLFRALGALKAVENDGSLLRGDVDLIWRAIAANLLNDRDTARWARRIAREVVSNVIDDVGRSEDRPKRALRALRIIGSRDTNFDELEALKDEIANEKYLNGIGRALGLLKDRQKVKFSDLDLLERMRARGFYPNLSNNNALKRLQRLLEKIPAN